MTASEPKNSRASAMALMCVTALGVVYGDIGTSPLYALRECFHAHGTHYVQPTLANILGILSLIFWSLIIVISIKYLTFILRADNRGEGGILALMALVTPGTSGRSLSAGRKQWILICLGLFGAALLYGDGMITPAISVLSAVEGLTVATPVFDPYVVPITVVILIVLFAFQHQGTAGIGSVFGPIMVVWFTVLAALGLWHIAQHPQVLAAINPMHGIRFFVVNKWDGFLALGSVFLVVTGGEALYADLGHFGTRPIRLSWFGLVLPSLMLNYLGQGALLIHEPEAAINPFFRMAPSWALYPLVGLATISAVIASQAVISGAFSLTMQAIQFGYSPRLTIDHTSSTERGQIYLPTVNWVLMFSSIGLVVGFGTSSNMAAAYGVAVTTTMVITTLLFHVLAREVWKWPLYRVLPLSLVFLTIDLGFFSANLLKIPHGGWFPLVMGAIVFTLLETWKRGREILAERLNATLMPLARFQQLIRHDQPHRVAGTAVFMHGHPQSTPIALLHNLKHNRVLHERIILLTVTTQDIPHVPQADRLAVEPLGDNFYRMTVRYGFMEDPDLPREMAKAQIDGDPLNPMAITFFLGRENLLVTDQKGMSPWRKTLFIWMSRNARGATAFFRLPPNRVVELGAQVEL